MPADPHPSGRIATLTTVGYAEFSTVRDRAARGAAGSSEKGFPISITDPSPVSLIEVAASLRYTVAAPTSFVFKIAVQETEHQAIVEERMVVDPMGGHELTASGEAGERTLRLAVDPGVLTLQYDATVKLSPRVDPQESLAENPHIALPGETLPYLGPSRYCESDRLEAWAVREFGSCTPGYARVSAVCNWVRRHLSYEPGASNERTSACDTLIQRAGVCRDYAHLAITFCRGLGIPARYVSGYAAGLEPPDFHGFFEAYLGSGWYLFDPTEKAPLSGLVRIASGRDAADAAFATIVGEAELQEMAVSARRLDDTRHGDREGPAVTSTA